MRKITTQVPGTPGYLGIRHQVRGNPLLSLSNIETCCIKIMLIYQCIRILASTSNIKIFQLTVTLFNLFYDHYFVEMHCTCNLPNNAVLFAVVVRSNTVLYKMLSYRRETALQGAL